MDTNTRTFRWIAAWVVFLAIISLINKTRFGSVVIYYSLVMILLVLVATQAPFIAGILEPIGSPVPGNDDTDGNSSDTDGLQSV